MQDPDALRRLDPKEVEVLNRQLARLKAETMSARHELQPEDVQREVKDLAHLKQELKSMLSTD